MIEQERGCGYRQVGGMYLEGSGLEVPCDRLPYPVEECPVCGQGIKFTRGFTWIHWFKYAGLHTHCTDNYGCPICHPHEFNEYPEDEDADPKVYKLKMYGLMWVGKKFYSPKSFIDEATQMGISKRISTIPNQLKVGKTWILLAHKEAGLRFIEADPEVEDSKSHMEKIPAVFYAFVPTRIVKILDPKEVKNEKEVESLQKRGVTPLVGITDEKGNVTETFTLNEWVLKNKGLKKKLLGWLR